MSVANSNSKAVYLLIYFCKKLCNLGAERLANWIVLKLQYSGQSNRKLQPASWIKKKEVYWLKEELDYYWISSSSSSSRRLLID